MADLCGYSYDYETGIFTGAIMLGASDADPRSPGTFLVPGNVVLVEPPRCSAGLWPFWRAGRWEVMELVEVPDLPPQPDPDDYWSNWRAS